MGYHSGLNGEYNIPVEVNKKHPAKFVRGCKENLPEDAIKVETYLKDDTIYFILPNNYKPAEELRPSAPPEGDIYGGKGNQKLNVDFRSSDPYSSGYYYKDNNDYINISDTTDYAQPNNTYVSIFDSLLDLNKQLNGMGCSAEEAGDAISNLLDKIYNK